MSPAPSRIAPEQLRIQLILAFPYIHWGQELFAKESSLKNHHCHCSALANFPNSWIPPLSNHLELSLIIPSPFFTPEKHYCSHMKVTLPIAKSNRCWWMIPTACTLNLLHLTVTNSHYEQISPWSQEPGCCLDIIHFSKSSKWCGYTGARSTVSSEEHG